MKIVSQETTQSKPESVEALVVGQLAKLYPGGGCDWECGA